MKNLQRFHLAAITGGLLLIPAAQLAARTHTTLDTGWKFAKVDSLGKRAPWQNVRVPHDWAVHEPFAREHDLQIVAVEQNGETEKTEKTGRTQSFQIPTPNILYTICLHF